jgi:hypothetical protein
MAHGHPRHLPDVTLRGRRGKVRIGPHFQVSVSESIWAKIREIEQTQGIYRTTLARRKLALYFGEDYPPAVGAFLKR